MLRAERGRDRFSIRWAEWFKAAHVTTVAVEMGEEVRWLDLGVQEVGWGGRHWKCQAERSVFILLFFWGGTSLSHKWILWAITRFWELQKQVMRQDLSLKDVFSVAVSMAADSRPTPSQQWLHIVCIFPKEKPYFSFLIHSVMFPWIWLFLLFLHVHSSGYRLWVGTVIGK